ncbi:MAG: hypothetical protein GY757_32355, partial [bacterium]|nr:hypothetical protein [bacterium]
MNISLKKIINTDYLCKYIRIFLVGALVAYLVLLFSPGLLNINPHLLLIIAAGDALVI